MEIETVERAVKWYRQLQLSWEGCICIGGGEPLLHPRIFDFIKLIRKQGMEVWMATNGVLTQQMHRLLNLCKEDREIQVRVSRDQFHGRGRLIGKKVKNRIDGMIEECESRIPYEYSNVTWGPSEVASVIRAGRAKELPSQVAGRSDCCCEGPFVYPSGQVMSCGCRDNPRCVAEEVIDLRKKRIVA